MRISDWSSDVCSSDLPKDAPTVIEFTDPDCPYCRALNRYWAAKAAEGKPVRRLIFFVSGIHPEAAAKSEHILRSVEHTSELQSLMRISYAVFCLKKKTHKMHIQTQHNSVFDYLLP